MYVRLWCYEEEYERGVRDRVGEKNRPDSQNRSITSLPELDKRAHRSTDKYDIHYHSGL